MTPSEHRGAVSLAYAIYGVCKDDEFPDEYIKPCLDVIRPGLARVVCSHLRDMFRGTRGGRIQTGDMTTA